MIPYPLAFMLWQCLGLHGGTKMQANLGDGQGWRDQEAEARWLYGESPGIGACLETFEGGNHFRSWQQSSSNAWFLAVSEERNLVDKHNITVCTSAIPLRSRLPCAGIV